MISRKFLKKWIPQGAILMKHKLKAALLSADWEYIPEGWGYKSTKVKGWNLDSIAEIQVSKWDKFCQHIKGSAPLFVNHESNDYLTEDIITHNTLMCFSYSAALASIQNQSLRLLDWGGGIGHYGKIAESILPDVNIKYTCYDLTVFCDKGKAVYPEAEFCDTIEKVSEKRYDLTLLSSSLWYDQDWQKTLKRLIDVSDNYIFITRMIFVLNAPSYIAIQRPYGMGYKTEYLCQIFNKHEVINFVESNGFTLIKEMFISDAPYIYKAPEQGKYRGFLFKRNVN